VGARPRRRRSAGRPRVASGTGRHHMQLSQSSAGGSLPRSRTDTWTDVFYAREGGYAAVKMALCTETCPSIYRGYSTIGHPSLSVVDPPRSVVHDMT
jgi:hypothetical protein